MSRQPDKEIIGPPDGWEIFDVEADRRYIDVRWRTRREAEGERQILLKGFAKNNQWRARLRVRKGIKY